LSALERVPPDGSPAPGDPIHTTMRTKLALCECLYFAGDFRGSFDLMDAARGEFAAIEDPELRGRSRYWLARLSSRIGVAGRIRQLAEQAIADSLSSGDRVTAANAYNVLCVERFFGGAPDEGIAAGRRALALLDPGGPSEAMGFAHHYISMAHYFASSLAGTLRATGQVLDIADSLSHPRLRCYGLAMRGLSLGLAGRHDHGLRLLDAASGHAPDEATRIFTAGYTGCIQLEAGMLEEGAESLKIAHEQCLEFPSPQLAAIFGAALADALCRLERTDDARAVAETAREVAVRASSPFGAGLCLRALGRLAARRAKRGLAIDLFEQAATTLQSAKAKFELARTYEDLEAAGADAAASGERRLSYGAMAKRLHLEIAPPPDLVDEIAHAGPEAGGVPAAGVKR
jgi:tetratricopeptide (TPR) repeat protein